MQEIVVPLGVPVTEVDGEDVFNPALIVQHHCEWQLYSWEPEGERMWVHIQCQHGLLRLPWGQPASEHDATTTTIETR